MPEKDDTVKYNYVDTYAYYCATRALMENEGFKFKYYFDSDDEEKEYDASYDEMYSYCQKKLYSDGYKIYTSIDLTMQQQLQDSIDLTLLDFTDTTDDGTFKLQSAATCIDNDTGEVVAIVGGRSQDAVSHTLNRAYQSHRQPGSSIKPLIVYTPSFERGKTPDTIVNDHKFDGGPSNSGDSYYGDVTIRFAVQKSLNTVAWQLYDELTPKVGLQYLKDMNFTNIVRMTMSQQQHLEVLQQVYPHWRWHLHIQHLRTMECTGIRHVLSRLWILTTISYIHHHRRTPSYIQRQHRV